MSSSDSVSTERKIGNVKWFNNKAGFGFITMGENTDSPKDVFAHYSNINVKNSQYKYLVQGEYVQFHIIRSTDSEHEYQAVHIQGILGGKLMCETIKDIKQNKVQYRQTHRDNEAPHLDTQQLLSLPVFNVGGGNDTRPFTVVRRGKPERRQASDLEPTTPRRPKNTNQRRQSFYQG